MGWKRYLGLSQDGLTGYELGDKIARGGMSEVFHARRKADGEDVAIKFITPEFSGLDELLSKIFQKGSEGEVAATLRHPNIVRTYEYGRAGDRYYIVMEFINGLNLKQLIDSRDPRWFDHRFRVLLEVGRGLQYIHRHNLVHRDFCPKNILLSKDGTAKIIDFGLAVPGDFKGKWQFDRSGTAAYMAPEQIRGQQVDIRTDIYAFGVSAYEILAGQRPFGRAKTRTQKMEPHLNIEPPGPRQFDATIPIALDHVILTAMKKSRDDRYQSMNDLMKDLQSVIDAFMPNLKLEPAQT